MTTLLIIINYYCDVFIARVPESACFPPVGHGGRAFVSNGRETGRLDTGTRLQQARNRPTRHGDAPPTGGRNRPTRGTDGRSSGFSVVPLGFTEPKGQGKIISRMGAAFTRRG
ncbi:hypothetical protein NHX12_020144 [Muraenolepis orangiensis]|uniref:Uncharacterized protein n=1 Tax=Muraenolepis orangiensis TaxID=630683 RepID=A0A9Q0IY52_9TELE|nr:hypothetical protein NHX12_020144 [Muraenolepis orangiensis]